MLRPLQTSYAGHPVVGTFGLPLVVYPGLKLNFLRPRFIRRLQQFKPDVSRARRARLPAR